MSSPQPDGSVASPDLTLAWSFAHPVIDLGGPYTVQCLIEIRAADAPPKARDPYDLALLIDRSGSMGRRALDLTRKVIPILLDRLGPDDRVALVAFADAPELLVPISGSHEQVRDAVDVLEAGGRSDIATGIRYGVDVLAAAEERGADRRLMIVTDADDLPDYPELRTLETELEAAKARCGIHAVALGLTHNWSIVTDLVLAGIEKAWHATSVRRATLVLSDLLPGLWDLVATDVTLELEAEPGVRVASPGPTFEARRSDQVLPHGLFRGERHRIVRSFVVPGWPGPGDHPVGTVRVSWKRPGTPGETSISADLHVTKGPGPLPAPPPDPVWIEDAVRAVVEGIAAADDASRGELPPEVLGEAAETLRWLGEPDRSHGFAERAQRASSARRRQEELLAWCDGPSDGRFWITVSGETPSDWVSAEILPAAADVDGSERRRRRLLLSVARQAAALKTSTGREVTIVRQAHGRAETLTPDDDLDLHGAVGRGLPEREAPPLPEPIVKWWDEHRGSISVRCNLHGEIARFDASRSMDMLGPAWDAAVVEYHWRCGETRSQEALCHVRIEPTSEQGGADLLDVEQMGIVYEGPGYPWWTYRQADERLVPT